jgi:hypothetical protein
MGSFPSLFRFLLFFPQEKRRNREDDSVYIFTVIMAREYIFYIEKEVWLSS